MKYVKVQSKKQKVDENWRKYLGEVSKGINNALDKIADENDMAPLPYKIVKEMLEVFKKETK
jgi:hypothetical protein